MAEVTEARGVYALDQMASRLLVLGEEEGEIYHDVPVRLISNPMDGLPDKLYLRFRENLANAELLSDRPNAPIQITVQYDLERR